MMYGKWKVEANGSVGEGGSGQVFKVRDTTQPSSPVRTLKLLKNTRDSQRRQWFKREIEALRTLHHPGILTLLEYDLEAEKPFYVAEYCSGGSLEKMGADRFKENSARVLKILLPILEALVAAHQANVFHRDIKPANILLREDGTPVLGDFGICYIENGEPITLSDNAVGSRNYIAPQMESGRHHLGDPSDRTDVYGLGKVLYWMISGGHMFAREDHRSDSNWLVPRLGDQRFEHVHILLDRTVVENPNNRLGSTEVRKELEMTASLVEGNYTPLKPSIGIRCRFCGIGTYEKYADSYPNLAGTLDEEQNFRLANLGIDPNAASLSEWRRKHRAGVRVLRCKRCGYVELFSRDNDIEDVSWWER